ncbi:MAG: TRAP transporter small permease [Candidatus Adiutrix sp.]|nr:TRAP transporter small permease [Candidatus Adiutrix sp.]
MERIGDILEKYVMGFLILLSCVMIAIGFAQVFSRYFLDYSLYWSEEALRYLFIWLVFLGMGPAIRHKGHVALEVLMSLLGPRGKTRLERLILALVLLFALVFTYFGAVLTYRTFQQLSPALELTMSLVYASLPLGGLIAIFYTLEQLKLTRPENKGDQP